MSVSEPARERRIVPPSWSESSNAPERSSPADAGSPDLETTAELPVLDVAAYEAARGHNELSSTDTWVAPVPTEARTRAPEDGASLERHSRLEDDLKALSARLREFEERLAHKGERLTEIEGELELARAAQTGAEQRADALGRELTDTRLALSTARAHAEELTQRLAARDAEMRLVRDRGRALDANLAARDRALARAQQQLEEMRLQMAGHLEALQSREGRRGVFEVLLRGLDGEVGRRESQVNQALREVAVHRERALAFTTELTAARERAETAESGLRAAEEAITRLEGELRAKAARTEELSTLNDDWHATLEAARQSLDERDSLIRRLEAEAAHSTALLDSIQQNIQLLDEQGANAEPEAAARLLIRTEGDGEVVHVLGRKTSIGRTPDNDVQIDTKFVSRHHAVILAGSAHAIIEDLNSTNGVLVNGRRITRQSLKDGDALTVGKTQFRFAVRPAAERRGA